MHSINKTNIIGTQESVYRDLSLGNLDRTQVGETVRFPLQDRFYSDSQRGFPITINNQTTSTFIQSIVTGTVSVINCTAINTPFRSVVSINDIQRNSEEFTVGCKELYELA